MPPSIWDLMSEATREDDDRQVIEFMLKTPGCCFEMDKKDYGWYPLHFLCQRKPNVKMLRLVHYANPDAVKHQDKWNFIPLHYACANGASFEVIEFLLTVYPDSVKVKANGLALHTACYNKAPFPVIQLLTSYYPASVSEKNINGVTPTELAKNHWAPTAVVEYLEKPITRLELQAEISEALAIVEMANKSKNPPLVWKGLLAEKRLEVLMPQRAALTSVAELKIRIDRVKESLKEREAPKTEEEAKRLKELQLIPVNSLGERLQLAWQIQEYESRLYYQTQTLFTPKVIEAEIAKCQAQINAAKASQDSKVLLQGLVAEKHMNTFLVPCRDAVKAVDEAKAIQNDLKQAKDLNERMQLALSLQDVGTRNAIRIGGQPPKIDIQ